MKIGIGVLPVAVRAILTVTAVKLHIVRTHAKHAVFSKSVNIDYLFLLCPLKG